MKTPATLFIFFAFTVAIVGCEEKQTVVTSSVTTTTEHKDLAKRGIDRTALDSVSKAVASPNGGEGLDKRTASTETPSTPEASVESKPSMLELHAPLPSSPLNELRSSMENLERSSPNEIRFLSWNVESEGANPDVICKQLSELNQEDRYDVVGLTEVMPQDLKKFRSALGSHYKYAYSKSGHHDRLQLLYNEDVYEKVRHFEIKEINVNGRYRSPLVVHLKHRESGSEFLAMLNHLARGKEKIRQQQAVMLVDWAREQTLPIIALGDYNFDYVFSTKKGNPAFSNMMRDGIWRKRPKNC